MIFQVMLVMPRGGKGAIMGVFATNHFMIVSFIFSQFLELVVTFMDLFI